MHRISWLALLAAMGAFAPVSAYAQSALPRVELELRAGDGSAVSGGVFVPFVLGDGTVLFGDGWVSYQDGGPVYGSVGGGVRHQFGDWVLGANATLDFANSPYDFSYQQLSAGLEALGSQFEFRINAFAPLGDTANAVDGLSTIAVRNGSFVANQGYEVVLYGVDAEAGIRLPVFDQDSANALKLFAGAFVQRSDLTGTISGLTARTELTLGLDQYLPGANMALGAGLRYDSQDQLSASVSLRLSAPIGGSPVQAAATSPLYQRIERNRAISTLAGNFGADEAAFASNGSSQVLQLSSANGPASDLNALIAAAGEGTIILASGDIVVDETLALMANQMFIGGGGVIDLHTADGQMFSYANPGDRTTLVATAGASRLAAPVAVDGTTLADGTTLSTLSITGAENAIVARDAANITIDNVTIDGVTGNGIVLNRVDNAVIRNSRISNTTICLSNSDCEFSIFDPTFVPNAAVNAVGVQNLTIAGLDIADVTYGIFIAPDIDDSGWPSVVTSEAENIDISNVRITNSRREALMTVGAHDITIDNLHVDNSALERDMDLVVFQTSNDITLTNSTLNGGVNGLMFAYYSGIPGVNPANISVSNVAISNTSRAGIFINPSNNLSFTDVTITNAGSYGIYMYGDNWGFMGGPVRDIAFSNVAINGAADAAVYLTGPIANVQGAVSTDAATPACEATSGPWSGTTLTQDAGYAFTIAGMELTGANLGMVCGQ